MSSITYNQGFPTISPTYGRYIPKGSAETLENLKTSEKGIEANNEFQIEVPIQTPGQITHVPIHYAPIYPVNYPVGIPIFGDPSLPLRDRWGAYLWVPRV